MVEQITFGKHAIGHDASCFVIAEAGVNHNGKSEIARQLIDAALSAGANAVKFQTFKAESVASSTAPKAMYQLQKTNTSESQLDMLRKLELSADAYRELYTYCKSNDILFLSTPFDAESADFLDDLGMEIFKIASGEITNLPFLEHIARKNKPIILSTGMSYLSEVDEAVRIIHGAGCDRLVLLHCVSDYPADFLDVNLRAMQNMATAFRLPVGYSDHTPGIEASLASVALGAYVIEKHITLDKTMSGPDHAASLEPDELNAMIAGIRNIEQAMGNGIKAPAPTEMANRRIVRRSLAAARTIPRGAVLQRDMLQSLRPASGIPPSLMHAAIGLKAKRTLEKGEFIAWNDFQ